MNNTKSKLDIQNLQKQFDEKLENLSNEDIVDVSKCIPNECEECEECGADEDYLQPYDDDLFICENCRITIPYV